jgi:tetratricopeptide (TPR) repeat protein
MVYSRIGDCYFKLNDYKSALASYRVAVAMQKQSDQAPTRYWIGLCSFLLGRNKEAVDEFLKIPALAPSSGMWVSTAYYWAGRASAASGNKEQAAEYFRKAGGKGKAPQEQFAMKKAEGMKKGARVQ